MKSSQKQKDRSSIQDTKCNLETQLDYLPTPPDFAQLRLKIKSRNIKSQQTARRRLKTQRNSVDNGAGFKFSKDQRFYKTTQNCQSFCSIQIPSTKSKRACTFGYGKRQPISKVIMNRSEVHPSPDKYTYQKSLPARGVPFPSGRQSQVCRYVSHRKDVYSQHFNLQNPDGKYQVRKQVKTKPITMSKRLKMFTDYIADTFSYVPGPQYSIDEKKLSNIGGYERGASIKTGRKMDIGKPLNENPGPQYTLSGFCDRFAKLREKNNLIDKKSVNKKKRKLLKQRLNTVY